MDHREAVELGSRFFDGGTLKKYPGKVESPGLTIRVSKLLAYNNNVSSPRRNFTSLYREPEESSEALSTPHCLSLGL